MNRKIKQEVRKRGKIYRFFRNLLRPFGHGPEDYYAIIPDLKIVFFYLPKNGNTSLKRAIYKNLYGQATQHIHKKFPVTRFKNPEIKNYFKFAFVRNPFDRLVSAYEDKIVSPGQLGVINSHKEFYENMSFKEFVKIVSKTPDKKLTGISVLKHDF